MNTVKRNKVGILGANVANMGLVLFMNTFLVAELFARTYNSLLVVGIYHLVLFAALFLGFAITSYVVKRASRVWAIRVCAVTKVAAVLLVIIFQDYIPEFYILFAAIFGFAEGIFWGSVLTLTAQSFSGKKMGNYVAWEQIVRAGASIVFPFTLGAIIGFVDFGWAAVLSAVIGLVLIGFTMICSEQKTKTNNRLSIRKYLRAMKDSGKSLAVWSFFFMQVIYDAARRLPIIFIVLIMVAMGDSFSLGVIGSIFAALNILFLVIYRRVRLKKAGAIIYWISVAAPIILGAFVLLDVTLFTIVLIHLGYVAIGCVARAEIDKARPNLMTYLKDEQWQTESLLLTEIGFMVCRIIVPSIIIAAYFANSFLIIQILAVALAACALVSGIWNHIWQKKYRQD